MKLVIDIGNTSVTCGLLQNTNIIQKFNINSINVLDKHLENISKNKIEKIIISSVVPKLTKEFINYLNKTCRCKIRLINHSNSQLSLKVPKPNTIGKNFRGPSITAITVSSMLLEVFATILFKRLIKKRAKSLLKT